MEGCHLKASGPKDSISWIESHGEYDVSHAISMVVLGRRTVCSHASP